MVFVSLSFLVSPFISGGWPARGFSFSKRPLATGPYLENPRCGPPPRYERGKRKDNQRGRQERPSDPWPGATTDRGLPQARPQGSPAGLPGSPLLCLSVFLFFFSRFCFHIWGVARKGVFLIQKALSYRALFGKPSLRATPPDMKGGTRKRETKRSSGGDAGWPAGPACGLAWGRLGPGAAPGRWSLGRSCFARVLFFRFLVSPFISGGWPATGFFQLRPCN